MTREEKIAEIERKFDAETKALREKYAALGRENRAQYEVDRTRYTTQIDVLFGLYDAEIQPIEARFAAEMAEAREGEVKLVELLSVDWEGE